MNNGIDFGHRTMANMSRESIGGVEILHFSLSQWAEENDRIRNKALEDAAVACEQQGEHVADCCAATIRQMEK